MSSFYARMAATSLRLITKFGQAITLTSVTTGAYSPATGAASQTTTTQTVRGVEEAYAQREIDGTNVLSGDKRVVIAASGITAPQVNDICTMAGTDYMVKKVDTLAPGGTPLTYTLQLR